MARKSKFKYYCLWKNEFDYKTVLVPPILIFIATFVVAINGEDWGLSDSFIDNYLLAVATGAFLVWMLSEYTKLLRLNPGRWILCFALMPLRFLGYVAKLRFESSVDEERGRVRTSQDMRNKALNEWRIGDAEKYRDEVAARTQTLNRAENDLKDYENTTKFRMRKYNQEIEGDGFESSSANKTADDFIDKEKKRHSGCLKWLVLIIVGFFVLLLMVTKACAKKAQEQAAAAGVSFQQ